MVEAGQEPETEIEKRMRHPVSYQNLLLWALNDVRLVLANPDQAPQNIEAKLKSLLALVPPELVEQADAIYSQNMAAYHQAIFPITHRPVYRIVGPKSDPAYRFDHDYSAFHGKEFDSKADLDEFIDQNRYRFERGNHSVETVWVERKQLSDAEDRLIELYRQFAAKTLRELVGLLDDNGLLREIKREDVGRL